MPSRQRHAKQAAWPRSPGPSPRPAWHGMAHKRIRLYRPQTDCNVERFNRTLLDEWADRRPYTSNTGRTEAC